MRTLISSMIAISAVGVVAMASDPKCEWPKTARCSAPILYCSDERSCTTERKENSPLTPESAFITSPQRGDGAGETNSMGIRFGALGVPQLTLQLPTVQLPGLVRYRRDAETLTESNQATFASGSAQKFEMGSLDNQATETTPIKPDCSRWSRLPLIGLPVWRSQQKLNCSSP